MTEPTSNQKDSEKKPATGVSGDLLEMLVCPLGKAELRLEGDSLICTRCGPAFKIEDGIPIMLIEEATLPGGIGSIHDLPCQKESESESPRNRS